jgi:thiamine-monophosphate kinase
LREFELIRWIADRTPAGEGVVTGIGDDCAVLDHPGGAPLVVTTDLLLEGTHFHAEDAPEDIGWKALAVSISDVAAMGCRSRHAFLAAGLPRRCGEGFARRVFEGALRAAAEFEVSLAGGDTTASRTGTSICSTVIGTPPAGHRPVLRSGASPGEAVLVTGRLGGSLAGRHLRFTPRQREALLLVSKVAVGAMIDLSDGLSSDARHLAERSGVRLRLFADRIPVSDAAAAEDPLGAALHDGEDFELLFTVPGAVAEELCREGLGGTPVTRIGEVVEGSVGVALVAANGREHDLKAGGYEHFRS